MTEEEYRERYILLAAKFSDKFMEDRKTSNVHAQIFKALAYGVDNYKIIEDLCNMVSDIQNEFKEHLKWSPPKPIILSKEEYDSFLKSQGK